MRASSVGLFFPDHETVQLVPMRSRWFALAAVWLAFATSGCSIRKMAVGSLADAISSGESDVFASDDDPQLIREALPFALKTYESLLVEAPNHRNLLVATARGFALYAYAFVQRDGEILEEDDLAAGIIARKRARRLMLRGRDYALRALDVSHPGIGDELRVGKFERIAETGSDDLAALYWSGAAWGSAVSVLPDAPDLIADLPVVEALLRRVLAIDESFDRGAAHEALLTLEAVFISGSIDRAEEHFARAVELTGGNSAGPFVSYAENIAVKQQDRSKFEEMLHRALDVDTEAEPEFRLVNAIAMERASWLLERTEDLFLE